MDPQLFWLTSRRRICHGTTGSIFNCAPQDEDVWKLWPKASRWTGNWWWNLTTLFWSFENNEQSMGTKRWGCTPNFKAKPFWKEGTLQIIFFTQTQRALCHSIHTRQETASRENTTETVLSELNKYYEQVRPTLGMCGFRLSHDNALAHKSKLICTRVSLEEKHSNFATSSSLPGSCTMWFFTVSTFKDQSSRIQIQLPFSPWIHCFPVSGPHPKTGL